MSVQAAKDGEVGLVYMKEGRSYAVALTETQHAILQAMVPALGTLSVPRDLEVQFVKNPNKKIAQKG